MELTGHVLTGNSLLFLYRLLSRFFSPAFTGIIFMGIIFFIFCETVLSVRRSSHFFHGFQLPS